MSNENKIRIRSKLYSCGRILGSNIIENGAPHTTAPLFISFRVLTQMASLPYAAHPPYSQHFEA